MPLQALVRSLATVALALASLSAMVACDDPAPPPDDDGRADDTDASPDLSPCGTCMPGLHCEPSSGTCQECLSDDHCTDSPNGNVCAAGLCVVPECDDDGDCGVGEACVARRCQTSELQCSTALDCPPEQPACIALGADTRVCRAFDECLDDDAAEHGDDGPAGARPVEVAPGQTLAATARICSAPASEVDTWRFTVSDGDRVTLVVTPSEPDADLDIEVYDSRLVGFGASFWRTPEVIDLGYLPGGDYFLAVTLFTGDVPRRDTLEYTVEITRTAGACATTTDCTALWDSASQRSQCASTGACQPLTTAEPRAEGEPCDSPDDCDSQLCAGKISTVASFGLVIFDFFAHAESRAVCSRQCSFDDHCAEGMHCEAATGLCALPCASSDECPVYSSLAPEPGDAWRHMTCDAASQRCIELDPALEVEPPVAGSAALRLSAVATHGPGVIAVRADDGSGAPGEHLGSAVVASGLHQDITVALGRAVSPGEPLHVALHRDLDPVGTFDAQLDPIASNLAGAPVVVTAPAP